MLINFLFKNVVLFIVLNLEYNDCFFKVVLKEMGIGKIYFDKIVLLNKDVIFLKIGFEYYFLEFFLNIFNLE